MLVLSRFLLSSDSANIKKLRQSYTDFSNPLDKIRYQYTRRHINLPSEEEGEEEEKKRENLESGEKKHLP
ncbi:hypothetical protein B296_00009654 [Ensete ventricosum]|uniref:Uncharacterized protein n=1 Tax=Ensete ventricosum TaxID=4639 RepID=A0A427BAH6_ENSVE|nr:hypothetical protein B296_00009654 [Ensete ventricosum]